MYETKGVTVCRTVKIDRELLEIASQLWNLKDRVNCFEGVWANQNHLYGDLYKGFEKFIENIVPVSGLLPTKMQECFHEELTRSYLGCKLTVKVLNAVAEEIVLDVTYEVV